MQSFHNRLIEEGMNFNDARRLTQWHYQWVVVNDYLPHVVGQDRVNLFLGKPVNNGFYKPGNPDAPMTPTEFSTAVFRYGHSQVRDSYEVNDLSEDAPIKVFDLTPAPRTCAAARTSTSGRTSTGSSSSRSTAPRSSRATCPASWTPRSPSRCSTCRWAHPGSRARAPTSWPS